MVSALTLLGGSAFAAFTANASTTNNTFSTDLPSLKVSVDGGSEGPSVAGVTVTNLYPGGPVSSHTFTVHNTGANTLAVDFKFNNDGSSTLPGSDTTVAISCTGGNTFSDSYAGWMTGHSLGNVGTGVTMNCTMDVSLNSGVSNSDAGLFDKFDGLFTGTEGS